MKSEQDLEGVFLMNRKFKVPRRSASVGISFLPSVYDHEGAVNISLDNGL